jgi:AraC-like DNA-binding protein
MTKTRIQVLLDKDEKLALQEMAQEAGVSVSALLRKAGQELLESRSRRRRLTAEDLAEFFQECSRRERGEEPDWEQHLRVIEESRAEGVTKT